MTSEQDEQWGLQRARAGGDKPPRTPFAALAVAFALFLLLAYLLR